MLIEWPTGEPEPTKYWLSTLPANIALVELVHWAKHRWIIERDYHATLCIEAYGFLVAERSHFFPLSPRRHLGLPTPASPPDFRPRGSPRSSRAA